MGGRRLRVPTTLKPPALLSREPGGMKPYWRRLGMTLSQDAQPVTTTSSGPSFTLPHILCECDTPMVAYSVEWGTKVEEDRTIRLGKLQVTYLCNNQGCENPYPIRVVIL